MAGTVLVDAGFLAAFIVARDASHAWALSQSQRFPPPWHTCDAVISEALHLIGPHAFTPMASLIRGGALVSSFQFANGTNEVLALMEKYSDVPMSFADACLVRMTEVSPNPTLLTTDNDFRVYRRHGRQAVPCIMPT
jgi:predicted nucleic acid-binding protein